MLDRWVGGLLSGGRAQRGGGLSVGLLALALLAGCAGSPDKPEPVEDPYDLIAPVGSSSTGDLSRGIAAAKAAKAEGRFEEAGRLYRTLGSAHPDAELRAEFLFQAAESEFRRGAYYESYQDYSRLLKLYPTTKRFSDVVLQVFEIARLFAEGQAEKPSWFFGVSMTDREFGIEILEKFQRARERHSRADDALHYKAQALYDLDEWDDAITTWDFLLKEYPDSEWAETAHYRIGLTKLQLSDGPEYDKGPIRAALFHLRSHVKRYPKGDHTADAKADIQSIEEGLSAQWLKIARFYLDRDEDYSATIYLTAIDRVYPHTEAAREAKRLHATIPKSSPPPPPVDPEGLETHSVRDVERFQKAPPPADPGTPKPSD